MPNLSVKYPDLIVKVNHTVSLSANTTCSLIPRECCPLLRMLFQECEEEYFQCGASVGSRFIAGCWTVGIFGSCMASVSPVSLGASSGRWPFLEASPLSVYHAALVPSVPIIEASAVTEGPKGDGKEGGGEHRGTSRILKCR